MATGLLDAVDGHPPAPITVWRLTTPDPAHTSGDDQTGSTVSAQARLALLLLATFTRTGEVVVDLAGDVVLAGVAGAGARRYHHLPPERSAQRTAHLHGRANLVYAHWPPELTETPNPTASKAGAPCPPNTSSASDAPEAREADVALGPRAARLLGLCAGLLTPRGTTVIAVHPEASAAYMDHAALLIPAAHDAGLGYLQHLIAITTPGMSTVAGPLAAGWGAGWL